MTEPPIRVLRWLRRGWRLLVGDSWRLAACRVLAVLAALGIGGWLFVSLGLVPVAASEGHWRPTRLFLHFVMQRSVATRTTGWQAPPLDDPALAIQGAGHYATGCMPCHGAPGVARALVAQRMMPPPPQLAKLDSQLRPEETFWVIKHGLKYTAMPAWVAQGRGDEVWAMVAFLQRLPRLDEAGFRRLAYGEDAAGAARAGELVHLAPSGDEAPESGPALANCIRCHGRDGAGRGDGVFPRLAGQTETYLRASLHAYARGDRHSGMMQPAVAGLDPRELDRLARHFAMQDARASPPHARDAAALERGRRLALQGEPSRRIAACAACHGPGDAPRNPMYPELAGQYQRYLALQLRLFKLGERGGTAHATVMRTIAAPLQEGDIQDLAAYYASLR